MKVRKLAALGAATVLAAAMAACGTDDDAGGNGNGNGNGEWPDEIVLGLVPSQDVDELVEDADVLADLISAELDHPVRAEITQNYTALVVAMQTGQAHIGMFGPIALVQAADQADANVVLQSIRRGTESYHTQWFTNNPERFCQTDVVEAENPEGNTVSYCNGTDAAEFGPVGDEALAEVEAGETIMFVDEGSASGYYYPATQLQAAAGLDPFNDIDAQFGGNHPNAALAVQRGDAEIGVSFDDVRNDLVEEDPAIGSDLVVFAWSDEIPNDGVAVAGDLPQDLQDAITDAFVAVIETDEGLQAFDDVYSIEGLVPADLDALDVARQVAANFGD
ncbi:phosphate/phosphite/phosphonate ABC transporter substrate-binding protein [Natronosporangium hydrolyticum]|uniref:Phosphate/phosphite/phosphonate ABC transporter substrate-binding protein n=1 Tax=Natronosporangium hydrolyticum TaxID=2811111 RepID=A0A895YQD8_9ACTN|nr:phosphate/phosphite/phosphonate ABC transporter substrate-binding protein [Natronosporangium hydrolyticum]QSB16956.1 phosphate/phosphite/phosphonate ABC transporter substrate-binding protein [Natronosporangium hydrolyticum]